VPDSTGPGDTGPGSTSPGSTGPGSTGPRDTGPDSTGPGDPVLDDGQVADAARRLLEAARTREPIRQLSLQYPDMTIEDAYRVQRALVALKTAEGRSVQARKIGLTSRAMQQSVSISEPDYGVIFDDMFFDDGGVVPFERFIRPRVEVELAFVLDRPLKGPGVTALDVLDATRWVTPALEILDARVQMTDPDTGHLRTIVDTISDNAADAGIVVGGRAVRPDACDLRRVAALLYVNEVIEETGVAAAVLNHPANGVAWLANKLAAYDESLPAGQVILAGSFTRPVFARAGDVFHADFGELGAVTCRFR
jgi:2-oxo-hept-3-ene-1,7-dioate hydratase